MPQEKILTIVYLLHVHYIVLYHIYNVTKWICPSGI